VHRPTTVDWDGIVARQKHSGNSGLMELRPARKWFFHVLIAGSAALRLWMPVDVNW
jgi:hypothetical protein